MAVLDLFAACQRAVCWNYFSSQCYKSDVMIIGVSASLNTTKNVTNIVAAAANLHPTDEQKSLGIQSSLTVA